LSAQGVLVALRTWLALSTVADCDGASSIALKHSGDPPHGPIAPLQFTLMVG